MRENNDLALMSNEEYDNVFRHLGTKEVDLSSCLSSELILGCESFRLPYGFGAERDALKKFEDRIGQAKARKEFVCLKRNDFYKDRKTLGSMNSVIDILSREKPPEANRFDFVVVFSDDAGVDERGVVRVHYYCV